MAFAFFQKISIQIFFHKSNMETISIVGWCN